MVVSDITAIDLQGEKIAPTIDKEYREQVTKRMKDDKYMLILSGYTNSIFQDFENYRRTEVDLVEDDIRLVLDENNSSFITCELEPGIYTFKDNCEALLKFFQSEYEGYHNAIDIEFDDVTMKTKLVTRPGIIAIRFDDKSFSSTVLGLNHGWDYKYYNKYNSQKIVNLSTTNKIHLKCDVIDGSVVNDLRQTILYSFVLDELPSYKVFSEPETIHVKKIIESVLNTISFCLVDDNNEKVNFNGKTLKFTLQMITI